MKGTSGKVFHDEGRIRNQRSAANGANMDQGLYFIVRSGDDIRDEVRHPVATPDIRHHLEDRLLEPQPDNTSDIQAALYEARDEVARLRQRGASDLEIAKSAVADFLRHLPSHVFEEASHHTGEPLNHALAHAVEAVALDDEQTSVEK